MAAALIHGRMLKRQAGTRGALRPRTGVASNGPWVSVMNPARPDRREGRPCLPGGLRPASDARSRASRGLSRARRGVLRGEPPFVRDRGRFWRSAADVEGGIRLLVVRGPASPGFRLGDDSSSPPNDGEAFASCEPVQRDQVLRSGPLVSVQWSALMVSRSDPGVRSGEESAVGVRTRAGAQQVMRDVPHGGGRDADDEQKLRYSMSNDQRRERPPP